MEWMPHLVNYLEEVEFSDGPHVQFPVNISFKNCTFVNNTSHVQVYKLNYTGRIQKNHGNGGGVYVVFRSNSISVQMLFVECDFIANHAFLGGGLSAEYLHGSNKKNG